MAEEALRGWWRAQEKCLPRLRARTVRHRARVPSWSRVANGRYGGAFWAVQGALGANGEWCGPGRETF